MPSKSRGGMSAREYKAKQKGESMPYNKKKMQVEALKKKTMYSGMDNGKPIDYSKKKYKGYSISSLD